MAGCTTFSLKEEQEENNPQTLSYIFARFPQTNKDVLRFLPQDQGVRLGLVLPACPPDPETQHWLSICMSGICMRSCGDVCLLCVSPTRGPGAPIDPGVPDLPCRTQRHRNSVKIGVKIVLIYQ